MFIKDGKTLFGNTGLILAIIILVLLLIFSYNKCYKQPEPFTFSRFADATNPNTTINGLVVGDSVTVTVSTLMSSPAEPPQRIPEAFALHW